MCHGFPSLSVKSDSIGNSYHLLAERISEELGYLVLCLSYRGCGESSGFFSPLGWLRDVHVAIESMNERFGNTRISLLGFGTGAALAIKAASQTDKVVSVVTLAARAEFNSWAYQTEALARFANKVGVIDDEAAIDQKAWSEELKELNAIHAAAKYAPRPLFLIHGREDERVPDLDSRALADAHGSADLRIIRGAGHLLRHDPRAIAMLLGWFRYERYGRILDKVPDIAALNTEESDL